MSPAMTGNDRPFAAGKRHQPYGVGLAMNQKRNGRRARVRQQNLRENWKKGSSNPGVRPLPLGGLPERRTSAARQQPGAKTAGRYKPERPDGQKMPDAVALQLLQSS